MSDKRIMVGAAITAHSAAATLPSPITSYADVSAWKGAPQQGPEVLSAYAYGELEIVGAAALNLTSCRLNAMTLDPLAVAAATFTTTHASETVNSTAHGLLTGDGPIRLTNSGGALPAGFAVDTDYYVIYSSANAFFLAASRALAFAGTKVAITGDGTGTHTYTGYNSGLTTCQRAVWLKVGLLGDAADGALSVGPQDGYVTRFAHSARFVGYALTGTLSASTVTVKFRPAWTVE